MGGIRTGRQFLDGLRDDREIWIDGERVADVTRDRRFAGGAQTMAELLDMQHDPALIDAMTFASPTSGDRVGLSHIQPRSADDLTRRRAMMKTWNDYTCGMFPRSPDFLNVMIASYASGAGEFGAGEADFAANVRAYHDYARENDVVMTHALVTPQVDRSKPVDQQDKDLAVRIKGETDAGMVVGGARMLATAAPFADELVVAPAPSYPLPETEQGRAYAMCFVIPVATPGLKLICRPSLAATDAASPLDNPLAARFDEADSMIVFDDVLVPWERVFIHRNVERYNNLYARNGGQLHMAHQFVTKDLSKAEFMLALGLAIADSTRVDVHLHVRGMLMELVNFAETVRACLVASEAGAVESPFGTVLPAGGPLQAMRFNFPGMFARACEIIRTLGAGGLTMVPSFAELDGGLAADVETYYQAANADSRRRIKLFRLAYDAAMSGFSGRQQLYERYFAGDPVRAADRVFARLDKAPHIARIDALLDELEARRNPAPDGAAFLPRKGGG